MARPGNTTQINISIPKTLDAKLRDLAELEHRSLSNMAALLIALGIKAKLVATGGKSDSFKNIDVYR